MDNFFTYTNNKKKIIDFLVKDIDNLIERVEKKKFKSSSKKKFLNSNDKIRCNDSIRCNNKIRCNDSIVLNEEHVKI